MAESGNGIEVALRDAGEGVQLRLKVVPGASRTRVVGLLGDRLKLQVAAAAEGGRANKAVCQLLARVLSVARAQVSIVAGTTQPEKTVLVTGMTRDEAIARLGDQGLDLGG